MYLLVFRFIDPVYDKFKVSVRMLGLASYGEHNDHPFPGLSQALRLQNGVALFVYS